MNKFKLNYLKRMSKNHSIFNLKNYFLLGVFGLVYSCCFIPFGFNPIFIVYSIFITCFDDLFFIKSLF